MEDTNDNIGRIRDSFKEMVLVLKEIEKIWREMLRLQKIRK